jgi:hypothetical protein
MIGSEMFRIQVQIILSWYSQFSEYFIQQCWGSWWLKGGDDDDNIVNALFFCCQNM